MQASRSRRCAAIAGTVLAVAAPAAVAAAPYALGSYSGHVKGGGRIALAVSGSSITGVRIAGRWHCSGSSYAYSASNRVRQSARIAKGGGFRLTQLTVSSPKTPQLSGVTGSLSGTVKGHTVTGRFIVRCRAARGARCTGGGSFTAAAPA